MINNIKLTYRFRDILLEKCGWLTDEHIDAAQYLIKTSKQGLEA
jgi:hypothetical protein